MVGPAYPILGMLVPFFLLAAPGRFGVWSLCCSPQEILVPIDAAGKGTIVYLFDVGTLITANMPTETALCLATPSNMLSR